jgi:oligoribonuclease
MTQQHVPADRMLWLDLETTGLDPERDRILEVAMVVTESDLTIVPASEMSWVVHQPDDVLDSSTMPQIVRDMHTASGLLQESRRAFHAEDWVGLQLLIRASTFLQHKKAPLCGNSIGALDRPFLVRHMPAVLDWLHYRMVDVSSVKELVSRWCPERAYGKKKLAHRALADIHESLDEARWYKEALFGPRALPTTIG